MEQFAVEAQTMSTQGSFMQAAPQQEVATMSTPGSFMQAAPQQAVATMSTPGSFMQPAPQQAVATMSTPGSFMQAVPQQAVATGEQQSQVVSGSALQPSSMNQGTEDFTSDCPVDTWKWNCDPHKNLTTQYQATMMPGDPSMNLTSQYQAMMPDMDSNPSGIAQTPTQFTYQGDEWHVGAVTGEYSQQSYTYNTGEYSQQSHTYITTGEKEVKSGGTPTVDAMTGEYSQQSHTYNTTGDKEAKSGGTPTNDKPAQYNKEERGEKRAAEDDRVGKVKRVKDDEIFDDDILNPVSVLNEKVPCMQFKVTAIQGTLNSPHYTMQITVGGQVFEASGKNKKTIKMMLAKGALKAMSEGKVAKEAALHTHVNVSPSHILHELRPQSRYELLEQLREDDVPYWRMKVTVDDEQFEAKGRSKLLAKGYAAMVALEKLFNLKFTVPKYGQMPTFNGDEQEWRKYEPAKNVTLFEGHKPMQLMHNMYYPLDYEIVEIDAPNPEDIKYHCTLKVENMDFTGIASSRNKAKVLTCLAALQYLKDQGILEQRQAEAAAAKRQRLASLKVEQEAADAQKAQSSETGPTAP